MMFSRLVRMVKPAIYILLFFFSSPIMLNAQVHAEQHLSTGSLAKLKHFVKKQIRKHKHGTDVSNNGNHYTTHHQVIEKILVQTLKLKYVVDAASDKCQVKISIYPGHSTIGVKVRTKKGVEEVCIIIQEGEIRKLNRYLGWLHYFKSRDILHYIAMKECIGFVEAQKKLCEEMQLHRNGDHD